MNLQQQEELQHEKGQVEEIKTVLLQKIERYESMIVDLDSVNRKESNSANHHVKNSSRYKGAKRRGERTEGEEGEGGGGGGGHGIEDARKVFGKLKSHVMDLQQRLDDKVADINKQVAAASDESLGRERDLKEFLKAVHDGQRDGDEGQHLMLMNQVVKALKEEVKIEGSILGHLIGDIKADLQMMDELQQDFNSLEMALRSRDLKEKGLNNIFKDLHNQVNEQKSIISMLTAENRELHGTVKNKEREHKLLEDQIYEFVDDISANEKQLASQKDQVERLEYQRRELENRLVAIEAEKLELEDQLLKSVGAGEVGWGAGGGGGGKGKSRNDSTSVVSEL